MFTNEELLMLRDLAAGRRKTTGGPARAIYDALIEKIDRTLRSQQKEAA